MMVLDLKCSRDHSFEGWFDSIEAFKEQKESGRLRCPICDDHQISRLLSPVAIKRSHSATPDREDPQRIREGVKQFYRYVEEHFQEVGTDFTKEALKMHYGVTEKRSIRGTSTADEEETLKKEGVEFFKLPVLKEGQ